LQNPPTFETDLQNQVIHCTSNVDGSKRSRSNEPVSNVNLIDHFSRLDKGAKFSIDYDKLVIGVGSYSQTFGIPGVKEHGLFLKDVNDARLIRSRVVSCKTINFHACIKNVNNDFNLLVLIGFEYASQPGITEEEKANRLHFAVVGGGPTVGYMLHHGF
jgi:NADH dehydrogenase FAD-containing subunit